MDDRLSKPYFCQNITKIERIRFWKAIQLDEELHDYLFGKSINNDETRKEEFENCPLSFREIYEKIIIYNPLYKNNRHIISIMDPGQKPRIQLTLKQPEKRKLDSSNYSEDEGHAAESLDNLKRMKETLQEPKKVYFIQCKWPDSDRKVYAGPMTKDDADTVVRLLNQAEDALKIKFHGKIVQDDTVFSKEKLVTDLRTLVCKDIDDFLKKSKEI